MKKVKYLIMTILALIVMPNIVKAAELRVGDYVEMTPTKTGYTVTKNLTGTDSNQLLTPNELKLWRIIRINSDGSYDAISEYTSSTKVAFGGKIGYRNFVSTLNQIAASYENSDFTKGSRMVGYDGQTGVLDDFEVTNISQTSTTDIITNRIEECETGSTYCGVRGDMIYRNDVDLIQDVYGPGLSLLSMISGTSTGGYYWLASRYYKFGDSERYTNDS